jgi:anti-sigma B factor antagonist
VIDQILIAQRDADDPLHHHGLDAVLHQLRGAPIDEPAREALHQTDRSVGRPEQQRAGVRGDPTAIERGHHLAPLDGFISEQIAVTLCWHRGVPLDGVNALFQKTYRRSRAPMHALLREMEASHGPVPPSARRRISTWPLDSPSRFAVEDVEDVGMLIPSGRVDSVSARHLEGRLVQLIDAGKARLVVDFSNVVYIGSGGIRVLLMIERRLAERSGRLVICCLPELIARLFRITEIEDMFTIAPTRDEAIANLGSEPSACSEPSA